MVGASLVEPSYKWNWFNEIANQRAVIVQLLIDPGHSECGFSETNAFLLGLQPSLNTASWAERNGEKLGESLAKLSNITEPFSKIASNILKTSAVMSNFVTSNDKSQNSWFKRGQKNWFLYRFLDEKRKCCAVEWNISRNVPTSIRPPTAGLNLAGVPRQPKADKATNAASSPAAQLWRECDGLSAASRRARRKRSSCAFNQSDSRLTFPRCV